jgi:hypothetical protein
MASVTRTLKKQLEYQRGISEFKFTEVFFKTLKDNEFIHADLIYDNCLSAGIGPKEICRLLPGFFKRFRKSLLIVKLSRYILSVRSSQPIPIYRSMRFPQNPDVPYDNETQDALDKMANVQKKNAEKMRKIRV